MRKTWVGYRDMVLRLQPLKLVGRKFPENQHILSSVVSHVSNSSRVKSQPGQQKGISVHVVN
jgi:hypothetical protein